MNACTSIEDNRISKGCIMVSYGVEKYQDRSNGVAYRDGMKLSLALPTNLSCYHFCLSNPAQAFVVKAAMSLAPPSIRAKTKIHYGSHLECQYSLAGYGIPREALPFASPTSFETMDLTHHQFWFQQCQEKEQQQQQLKEQHVDYSSSTTTRNNLEITTPRSSSSSISTTNNEHVKFLTNLCQGRGETPTDEDVLCVGNRVNGKGNERLMALAVFHSEAYDRGNRKERKVIVDSMVSDILAHGGRFLKLDDTSSSKGKGWVRVPDKEIREKIAQTFRNLRSYSRRNNNIGEASSSSLASNGTPATSSSTSSSTAMMDPSPAIIVYQYTAQDVLFGNKLKDHVGNQRLRELVQNHAEEYDAGHSSSRGEKQRLVNQLMVQIQSEGGRFLKPSLDHDGRWEVVPQKDAARKVGSHFRNLRRKHWR